MSTSLKGVQGVNRSDPAGDNRTRLAGAPVAVAGAAAAFDDDAAVDDECAEEACAAVAVEPLLIEGVEAAVHVPTSRR